MKIRTKFSLFANLLVLGLALGISAAVFVIERRNVHQALEREQAGHARNFAGVGQQGLATSDMLFVINYLKVLRTIPCVEWAFLDDGKGKILDHTDERFTYRPLSDWEAARPAGTVERVEPVALKGALAGRAHIGFSSAHMAEAARAAVAATLRWVGAVAALGALAGGLGAWALAFFMARPIRTLAAGAQRIGEGDRDVRLPVSTSDELGELTERFNRMAVQLKELDELKDEFISQVSHDLKSPLASIKMYVDYLLSGVRGPLNAEQKDMLNVCAHAAARLGIFIENILDSAKMKAGKMEYVHAPFKLADALEPVTRLQAIGVAQRRLSLELPAQPPPLLFGDRERVEHVLANLVSNAVKHTPEGGRIRVAWSWEEPGKTIRVSVENTGPGIPKDQLAGLFQRFYQADLKAQKEQKIKGTGLGLVIVRQTVEAHGGKVWVESEPNAWTRFHFTLPAAQAPAPAREAVRG